MKILMIEDDKSTVEIIRLTLAVCDPEANIQSTENGQEGLASAISNNFDVVVLDLGLPDMDGIEVLERLRAVSRTPVLIVSARHDPEVIDKALNSGAQDYVLKPFELRNFLASLKEVTHKSEYKLNSDWPERISETLTIRKPSREVLVNGQPVGLAQDEKLVLDILLDNRGSIVTNKTLINFISESGFALESTVQDIIDRLRKKLGDDPYLPQFIVSEYQTAYRFVRPAACLKAS
jgi:two-component system, OmpR family, KDP operon response regulator KdpE